MLASSIEESPAVFGAFINLLLGSSASASGESKEEHWRAVCDALGLPKLYALFAATNQLYDFEEYSDPGSVPSPRSSYQRPSVRPSRDLPPSASVPSLGRPTVAQASTESTAEPSGVLDALPARPSPARPPPPLPGAPRAQASMRVWRPTAFAATPGSSGTDPWVAPVPLPAPMSHCVGHRVSPRRTIPTAPSSYTATGSLTATVEMSLSSSRSSPRIPQAAAPGARAAPRTATVEMSLNPDPDPTRTLSTLAMGRSSEGQITPSPSNPSQVHSSSPLNSSSTATLEMSVSSDAAPATLPSRSRAATSTGAVVLDDFKNDLRRCVVRGQTRPCGTREMEWARAHSHAPT